MMISDSVYAHEHEQMNHAQYTITLVNKNLQSQVSSMTRLCIANEWTDRYMLDAQMDEVHMVHRWTHWCEAVYTLYWLTCVQSG